MKRALCCCCCFDRADLLLWRLGMDAPPGEEGPLPLLPPSKAEWGGAGQVSGRCSPKATADAASGLLPPASFVVVEGGRTCWEVAAAAMLLMPPASALAVSAEHIPRREGMRPWDACCWLPGRCKC
eukprot:scaffold10932_cov17-Tisochrysis_lutea.AAC.2